MGDKPKVVRVEHGPTQGLMNVLLPSWVRDIQVVARTDGRDLVTVVFTRRWEQERWMAMPVEGAVFNLYVWCLLGGGQKLCDESRVRAQVLVPPKLVRVVEARAFSPDKD